jgi:hypothetical protein
MITNFYDFANLENMGGCYELFNFIPANVINVMPKYDAGKYSSDLTFQSGSDWLTGRSLHKSISFSDEQITNGNGSFYAIKIVGFVPKLTYQYLHLFNEMSSQKFVIKITDNNGNILIFGTKKEPLSFKFSRTSEQSPVGLAGHKFEFYANAAIPGTFLI